MKKIVVVGLGLIGGSLAAALKGFEDYEIVGANRSRAAVDFARERSMADVLTNDIPEAVREGDVVICCLPPEATLDFLRLYKDDFKPGALVTDVCGVKTAVMEASRCLPESVDFIGGHPMAGKEKGGIENADPHLFYGAHYIITPRQTSTEEHISLMRRLAVYIGCRDPRADDAGASRRHHRLYKPGHAHHGCRHLRRSDHVRLPRL
jgi:prephenate dehydrogenase